MPGELLLCGRPCATAALPPGRQWADTGGLRRFDAAFSADLLASMGVRLALCLDDDADANVDDDAATRAAFLARGIRVVTLASLCAGSASSCASAADPWLRGLAAFSALAASAGGGAAVLLCGDRAGDRGRACALAAAWITARHDLFPSPEVAIAWAGLAVGGAAAPSPIDLAALRAHWARRWAGSLGLGRPSSAPTDPIPGQGAGGSARARVVRRSSSTGMLERVGTLAPPCGTARTGPPCSESLPRAASAGSDCCSPPYRCAAGRPPPLAPAGVACAALAWPGGRAALSGAGRARAQAGGCPAPGAGVWGAVGVRVAAVAALVVLAVALAVCLASATASAAV